MDESQTSAAVMLVEPCHEDIILVQYLVLTDGIDFAAYAYFR
jgi:hypothetical protein